MRQVLISAVLVAAALLGLPGISAAQHGGHGGGHSGGHGGSVSHGSFHSGSVHGGDFHGGNFHNGFHEGDHHHNGFVGGIFLGYPGYYGGYGYSPYYYSSPYYDNYSTPYSTYAPSYTSNYYSPPDSGTAPLAVSPGVDLNATKATIEVRVPAGAQLWLDGTLTKQTGEMRTFASPPLQTGRIFSYEFRARWMQDGKPVEQTRRVDVAAGQMSKVDFFAQ
jgi:uncharacterized protein (TIGR03000 family)